MDFSLSSEQVQLQDSLARLCREYAPLARIRHFAENHEPRATDVWQVFVELGAPGLLIAEQYGGSGLSLLDAALVSEVLGQHVAPLPFLASCVLVPSALQMAGSEAQCEQWLPRLAAGEVIAGAALSELTGAREDARIEAREGRLHGRALFVLDVEADLFLVAAQGGLYLVEAAAVGLSRQTLVTIDRTRRVGELRFDNVLAARLNGSDDPAITARLIDIGRVMLAADTLGAAQFMLDAAVTYTGQREQFGRLIGSFQAVKHLCAEMAVELEPCRAFVWYAAHALDAIPDEARLMAAQVKAHVAEVGKFVAKTATEVHGGVGFTDLLGLHYWFKRIGVNRQLLGSPERARCDAALAQGLVNIHNSSI